MYNGTAAGTTAVAARGGRIHRVLANSHVTAVWSWWFVAAVAGSAGEQQHICMQECPLVCLYWMQPRLLSAFVAVARRGKGMYLVLVYALEQQSGVT
jgi:hypothetical protein